MMPNRTKDVTGHVFGSLTALEFSHVEKHSAYWKYQCVCGNTHIARSNTVTYIAKTKKDAELPSCGCVELARKTKHGFRKAKDTHPAYRIYRGMMDRCYNKDAPGYQWYGAKGVTVCAEWLGEPEVFIQWALSNGWATGLHIDKDILCKSKGIQPHIYSPETCQWVTPQRNVSEATNRTNYGKHPNVRLSQQHVDEILDHYFSGRITNQSELARMYGLQSPSSVGRLVRLAKGAA